MSDNEEEEFRVYREDKRIPCQYGAKCYQKNATHQEKYKHPPGKETKKRKTTKRTTAGRKRKNKDDDQSNDSPKKKAQKKEDHVSSDEDLDNALACVDVNIVDRKDDPSKDAAESMSSGVEEPTGDSDKLITVKSLLVEENITIENDRISSDNAQTVISCLFFTVMPEDFFEFYEFCGTVSKEDPFNALRDLRLELVGPFDVFRDTFLTARVEDKQALLRHWRYYYDPPEFQTIVRDIGKDGLHYGYWRDDISEKPVFVAKNKAAVSCLIEPVAENLFGALDAHIAEKLKLASPFERTKIAQLHQKLKSFAKEKNITLEKDTANMQAREKQVVTRTFHKAGIVVPYNKKSQLGYRDLAVTDSELRKVLKQIENPPDPDARKTPLSKLEEVIRLATIAADECDFGTVLELGHDLFSSGISYVQNKTLNLLSLAYTLLHRAPFLEILQAHLKDRRRSLSASVLE